jgi:hypothetical protein
MSASNIAPVIPTTWVTNSITNADGSVIRLQVTEFKVVSVHRLEALAVAIFVILACGIVLWWRSFHKKHLGGPSR